MVAHKPVFVNKIIYNFHMLASHGNNSYLDEEEVLSLWTSSHLSPQLTSYIDHFIKNELASDIKNYYLFEKQREITLKLIRKHRKNFGNSFIFKCESPTYFYGNEFLLIHSLIALNHLKIIDLDDLNIEKDLFESIDWRVNIKAKVTILNTATFNREDLSISQPQFSFKNGVLHFKGAEILISKTKRRSAPLQILETVIKDPDRVWNYDEIWEDWGERPEDYNSTMWPKFYHASHAINRKIAQKTVIDNFLEVTNSTVNINKKYL